ncbi:hypothetical protein DFH29DRAFT_354313 [Suillus ampliporus]|nr:hypothetical protein DFH29DRAFT_354313 [Suillus ampliporus]
MKMALFAKRKATEHLNEYVVISILTPPPGLHYITISGRTFLVALIWPIIFFSSLGKLGYKYILGWCIYRSYEVFAGELCIIMWQRLPTA